MGLDDGAAPLKNCWYPVSLEYKSCFIFVFCATFNVVCLGYGVVDQFALSTFRKVVFMGGGDGGGRELVK